jgi:hypothetical protein
LSELENEFINISLIVDAGLDKNEGIFPCRAASENSDNIFDKKKTGDAAKGKIEGETVGINGTDGKIDGEMGM